MVMNISIMVELCCWRRLPERQACVCRNLWRLVSIRFVGALHRSRK